VRRARNSKSGCEKTRAVVYNFVFLQPVSYNISEVNGEAISDEYGESETDPKGESVRKQRYYGWSQLSSRSYWKGGV
jgi:hypothetical protein